MDHTPRKKLENGNWKFETRVSAFAFSRDGLRLLKEAVGKFQGAAKCAAPAAILWTLQSVNV
jgi:hypothetical protein